MAKGKRREQAIFFPWERRASLVQRLGLGRWRPVSLALFALVFLVLLGARERTRTGVRATRATLDVVHRSVEAYRADHEKKCPPSLLTLKTEGYLEVEPVDAWGQPLRLFCPGRRDPAGYELMSDGPDGLLGGLDRVE